MIKVTQELINSVRDEMMTRRKLYIPPTPEQIAKGLRWGNAMPVDTNTQNILCTERMFDEIFVPYLEHFEGDGKDINGIIEWYYGKCLNNYSNLCNPEQYKDYMAMPFIS